MGEFSFFMCPMGEWSPFSNTPCVYHTSISVSVFSTYILCLMSATNQKCWWKVPIFWKCCISQNFNDIIDYVIQIILKNKSSMWELVKEKSTVKYLIRYILYIHFCVWKIYYQIGNIVGNILFAVGSFERKLFQINH